MQFEEGDGFLEIIRRLNVAMAKAKSRVFVIKDPATFCNLKDKSKKV